MALSTNTWQEFLDLVNGMSGNCALSASPSTIQSLANFAAKRAYRSHFAWERFIVAGEPRTISRGYVAFSEDSFHVYGAGTSAVNGLYTASGDDYIKTTSDGTTEYTLEAFVDAMVVEGAGTAAANGVYLRDGDEGGKPKYTKTGDTAIRWNSLDPYWGIADLSTFEYRSTDDVATPDLATGWTDNGDTAPTVRRATLSDTGITADYVTWRIVDTSDNVVYSNPATQLTPPLTGWVVGTGTAPTPGFTDVADIDTFLDVHVDGYPPNGTGGWRADRRVSSAGCYVELGSSEANEVYVTYKAAHTDVYGDGTGGTTDAIPSEWFYYMALHVSRQLQIANRQDNGSPYAAIASREVEAALEDEHMKICTQGIIDSIGRQVTTGISNSTMLN